MLFYKGGMPSEFVRSMYWGLSHEDYTIQYNGAGTAVRVSNRDTSGNFLYETFFPPHVVLGPDTYYSEESVYHYIFVLLARTSGLIIQVDVPYNLSELMEKHDENLALFHIYYNSPRATAEEKSVAEPIREQLIEELKAAIVEFLLYRFK